MRRPTLHAGVALLVAVGALSGGGCVQKKVVAVRGGLQSLPGAKGGVRADEPEQAPQPAGKNYDRLLAKYRTENKDLVPDKTHPLRLVDPNDPKNVKLILRSPQDLVIQLYETLSNKEYDLLFDQVLSDQLKENYRELMKDPHEAVDYLVRNENDVRKLLATMPAADQTPGLYLIPLGDNMFRLEAPGRGALDMKFQELDMIVESGQFRLLLIH